MAVTIIKSPPEISFSRIPIWFGLQTDNMYATDGQASAAFVSFPNGPLANGVTFELSYNSNILNFSIADEPDDSGLQIRSGKFHPLIADLTLLEWCELFVSTMKDNFLMSRDFDISLDNTDVDPRVKFLAKEMDPKFDLTIADNPEISLASASNGIEKKRHPNFGICLEIWLENADHTGFDKIQEDVPLVATDDGKAYFNISRTLTEGLIGKDNLFERPDPALPVAMKNLLSCRKYYIRFAESYGNPQQVRKTYQSPELWVMLGGVGKADELGYSIPVNFHVGGFHRFLKQEASEKYVTLQHPEWLSLVWLTNPIALIDLRVKVYFTVGDPAEFSASTLANVNKYDKITFPVGPTQLSLYALYPDKIITKYEAWISDPGNTRYSEIRTYYLKYDYQSSSRIFCYLSSLGSYDTFLTVGKGSTEYELKVKRASFSKTVDFKFEAGETMDFDSNLEHQETVLTGHITKRDLKRYRDFFVSWDKFQVRNLRAYPVQVNSKNVKEVSDDDFTFSLAFETAYRFTDELWSEDQDDTGPSAALAQSQYLPPISNPVPGDWDHLYWRKTQTFNRAEILAYINDLITTEAAHHAAQQALIDALQLALAGKANTIHFHDDRYVKLGDFGDFVDDLNAAIHYRGKFNPAYTLDPDDPAVLPGYMLNNVVDHNGSLWRSLAGDETDPNTTVPGADPLTWMEILSGLHSKTIVFADFEPDLITVNDTAIKTIKTMIARNIGPLIPGVDFTTLGSGGFIINFNGFQANAETAISITYKEY